MPPQTIVNKLLPISASIWFLYVGANLALAWECSVVTLYIPGQLLLAHMLVPLSRRLVIIGMASGNSVDLSSNSLIVTSLS